MLNKYIKWNFRGTIQYGRSLYWSLGVKGLIWPIMLHIYNETLLKEVLAALVYYSYVCVGGCVVTIRGGLCFVAVCTCQHCTKPTTDIYLKFTVPAFTYTSGYISYSQRLSYATFCSTFVWITQNTGPKEITVCCPWLFLFILLFFSCLWKPKFFGPLQGLLSNFFNAYD